MRNKKKANTTSRFTRGRKMVAKKTRRHGRPRTEENRSEGLIERTLDRLTPA